MLPRNVETFLQTSAGRRLKERCNSVTNYQRAAAVHQPSEQLSQNDGLAGFACMLPEEILFSEFEFTNVSVRHQAEEAGKLFRMLEHAR